MLRMELRERKIKIVQAMDVAERYQHNRLGYVRARLHDIQQIELRRIELDIKKKTVVVGGQIIAKIMRKMDHSNTTSIRASKKM